MKARETQRNAKLEHAARKLEHAAGKLEQDGGKLEHGAKSTAATAARNKEKRPPGSAFEPVKDARGRRVRGLQIRNGRFYATIWADAAGGRKASRKIPLIDENEQPVTTLTAAREAQARLVVARQNDALPAAGRKPMLADYIKRYTESPIRRAKLKAATIKEDDYRFARWLKFLGNLRIDKITPAQIRAYKEKRLGDGASPRTVNLDLTAMRGLLKCAIEDGHIRTLPAMKAERHVGHRRQLITPAQFAALVAAARRVCARNGEQVADFLQFLAYSGAREKEALRLRWADIDMKAALLTIGSDGETKSRKARTVEFNPQLAELLADMATRRAPDSEWLFPSPRRGDHDRPAESFRESMRMAREAAGLVGFRSDRDSTEDDTFAFHHLRHYFASMCVMSGIDVKTVAAWLGHSDGGILVLKCYGHLLEDHRRRQAQKVNFGLHALPDPVAKPA